MRNVPQHSRVRFYERGNKKAQRNFKTAGDVRMVEGPSSQGALPYPAMLRPDYVFPPDPDELTPDEIIQSGGCQQLRESL